MEIVTMDNEVVKTMMEKIDRIADYVFKKDNVPKEEAEILLTSEEAADLLKISTRTLWKSHSTLTLLATQDLPTFLYYMIDPLKSWCWGAILFYPFKNSRFS